jgi:hypothetical protein
VTVERSEDCEREIDALDSQSKGASKSLNAGRGSREPNRECKWKSKSSIMRDRASNRG